jgi:hypothetical protein
MKIMYGAPFQRSFFPLSHYKKDPLLRVLDKIINAMNHHTVLVIFTSHELCIHHMQDVTFAFLSAGKNVSKNHLQAKPLLIFLKQ